LSLPLTLETEKGTGKKGRDAKIFREKIKVWRKIDNWGKILVRGVYYCSVGPTVQVHTGTLYRNVEANTAVLLVGGGMGGGCAWARKYISSSSRL
jgi:hypothetical protein